MIDKTASLLPAQAVPDPSPELPTELSSKVDSLLGIAMALVIAACVLGFFICAGKLAMAWRRGEAGEAAGGLAAVAAACVLIGSGSAVVSFLYA